MTTPTLFENLLVRYARGFPVRRGKLRLINALWRTAAGTHGTRRVAELAHGGFRMPCDLSEMLQRQYYYFGTYFLEQHILDCWERAARTARVVFDIGANAGIFSLSALAVRPDATVHAFEPTPELAAQLRATAALNRLSTLHVHEIAIHREDGWAALHRFRGESGHNEGMNFVTRSMTDVAERVRMASIDGFCHEHGIARIDLLKLDIQGNEPEALEGAAQMLRDGRIGMLFVELNWAHARGTAAPARVSIDWLAESGYRFAAPGNNLNWREAGPWLESLTDVVARRG